MAHYAEEIAWEEVDESVVIQVLDFGSGDVFHIGCMRLYRSETSGKN